MAYKRTTTSWGNKGSKSRSTTTFHSGKTNSAGTTRSSSWGSNGGARYTTTEKSTQRKDGTIKHSTVFTTTTKDANGFINRSTRTVSSGAKIDKTHKFKAYKQPKSSTTRGYKTKKQQAADNALSMALIVLLGVGTAIYYAVNYVLEVVGSFINSF